MSRSRLVTICRTTAVLLVGSMIAAGCGSNGNGARATSYCAILSDTVGLYVGNPVTQMGFQLGTISKITPGIKSVRVDFSVTDGRLMPQDVKAVIRSTSILADRALELVGNYGSGPTLQPGECVPLSRTVTPKSLSEVIGSANTFVKGISPADSSNIGDVVSHFAQATHDVGPGVNEILTKSSELLNNPDTQISQMGSIVGNLADLTQTLVHLRDPMKQILNDSVITTPFVRDFAVATANFDQVAGMIIKMLSDLEVHAGDELQLTLDAVSDVLRINTPHAPGWVSLFGGILKPLPFWINDIANHLNNHEFHLFFRPPMYRIRTPDGPLVCAIMNSSNPGSCANVSGQPYGVDINLLQYVFMNANR